MTLSAGFSGSRYWSVSGLPAPTSFPFLGKPMNLRRLVQDNDDSTVSSLALLIATCSQRRPVRFRVYLVLSPLYGLMVSRYRRGYAVHWSTTAVGNYAQHRAPSCEGLSPSPSSLAASAAISRERVAPHKRSYVLLESRRSGVISRPIFIALKRWSNLTV